MSNGKKITRKEAQELMDNQLLIAKDNRNFVADDCKKRGKEDASIYYRADNKGQPANCYIFDMELVKEFADNGATQLLVILGAQTKAADTKGSPTIILVGCTMEMENEIERYDSLQALEDYPAVEHPPVTTIQTLP